MRSALIAGEEVRKEAGRAATARDQVGKTGEWQDWWLARLDRKRSCACETHYYIVMLLKEMFKSPA